jgi:Double-GTPase 2
MGEGILALLGIAAYLAALAAYTVFVAPFVAAGAALFFAGRLVADYGVTVRGVLVLRTPDFQVILPHRPEDEPQPAYRQYFFGPAVRDLRQVVMIARPRCAHRAQDYGSWINRSLLTGRDAEGLATIPIGITLWAGLIAGCALAGVVLSAIAALHVLAVLTVQVLARATIGVLRGIDTLVLRLKGIGGMICPWCYRRSSYPSYECPNCRRLHSDVRPGRYGVMRRRCQCRETLPTLLILGSYRLPAMCTNRPTCGRQMSDETGRFAEFVLPFFGGQSAGKTRLMAAMIMGLHEAGRDQGASVRLADDETRHSYEVLREVLSIRGNTLGTHGQLPRAHSVLVTMSRFKRLLHIFDAAGERFADVERTDELRYLRAARTYLFVLDPMSVPEFWSQLTPRERDGLDRALASEMSPETVFNQSVQTMLGMRAKIARSRLAVAVSKTDVIEHTGLLHGRRDDSAWVERWLIESLGQGNLVRAMRNEFLDVRFFFTAAVMDGEDHVHGSISPLVTWCLQEERIRSQRGRPPALTGTARHGRGWPHRAGAEAAAGSGRHRA